MGNRSRILWIILGVILVGLGTAGIIYLPSETQATIPGFSTLSLTQADLTSDLPSDSPFSGEAWILTVRQGGLAQRAEGNFDPEDIEDETSGDLKTEKDFSVTVDYENQECVYPIGSTNLLEPIKNLAVNSWLYVPLVNPCTESEAEERIPYGANIVYYGRNDDYPDYDCFVIYETGEQSPVGNFDQTDLRSRMNVNIEAGDRSGSKILDTEGSVQGAISNFAYVIWQGNLDTGKSCSYTTDNPYRPAYVNGRWRIINKNRYDQYISAIGSQPNIDNLGTIQTWVDNVNSKASSARISVSFGTIENPTSLNNAIVREEMQYPLQYPVLTFYIKASTLGIYTPAPEIDLISATSDCFRTGEDGIIKIKAKNTGNEDGVWNFYGECEGTFDITQSREYGFDAGQTRTVNLPISASASSKTTGTCTVYAENVAGTESISVNVCVDPQITCNAGQKFCSTSGGKDVVKQCSSDGATSSIVEICGVGEVCENAKCVKDTGNGGFFSGIADFFKDLWKKTNDFISEFRTILSIVLGAIAGLFTVLFARNLEVVRTLKQKAKAITLITLFIIIGGGIGFLAYVYFWIGLLILVGILILKIFI